MHRILFIIFFLAYGLFAQPFVIAKLNAVPSNSLQIFTLHAQEISCVPYGVLTLGMIRKYRKINSVCREKIDRYISQHPNRSFFASMHLYLKAYYTLKLHPKGCLLYARGQKSLSEMLLEEGLAVIAPGFSDEEFLALFQRAQNRAKYAKRGVWSTDTLEICALGLYK
jgi:hypothetical protein